MRKYEVMLTVNLERSGREGGTRFEVEADGIGYHDEGDDLIMVLYVLEAEEKNAAGDEPQQVERPIFATPVRILGYVKDLDRETSAVLKKCQAALDEIEDLEPVAAVGTEHMGVPDGDYLSRKDVFEIIRKLDTPI